MILDLALAVVALLFGLLGLRSGAIRQLSHWLGLACGYLGAGPLAAALTPAAAAKTNLPAAGVKVALGMLLFVALGGLASWLVHAILVIATGGGEDGRLDRAGGFLLGAGKGAALGCALLAATLYFEKPLNQAFGATPGFVRESAAARFLGRHDLLSALPLPVAAKLEKLALAAKDPAAARALADEPNLKALLASPEIRAVLQDPALTKALASGDLSSLKNDPRFSALLNDPRLARGAR